MIIRKRIGADGKRSASAWIDVTGISFGVTDYDPCLGYIDTDADGDVIIAIYKKRCKRANVKIRFVEE